MAPLELVDACPTPHNIVLILFFSMLVSIALYPFLSYFPWCADAVDLAFWCPVRKPLFVVCPAAASPPVRCSYRTPGLLPTSLTLTTIVCIRATPKFGTFTPASMTHPAISDDTSDPQ